MTLSGSSAYRAEGRRRDDDDDDDDHRSRDRSPLGSSYDRQDYSSSSYHPSSGKQKLTFGFDKKGAASNDPKKGSGIQMKLGGSSVSNLINLILFSTYCLFTYVTIDMNKFSFLESSKTSSEAYNSFCI